MDLIEFIQKFFLLLLPGTVGLLLYHQMNRYEERHYSLEFLKLICFSLASYYLADIPFWILGRIPGSSLAPVNMIERIGSAEMEKLNIPASNVWAALAMAALLAFGLTKANDEELLSGIADRISQKRRERKWEQEAVWHSFAEQARVVVVRDHALGYVYSGKLEHQSTLHRRIQLHLSNVSVRDQQSRLLYHTDQMYLSREHHQLTLEIYEREWKESVQQDVPGNQEPVPAETAGPK